MFEMSLCRFDTCVPYLFLFLFCGSEDVRSRRELWKRSRDIGSIGNGKEDKSLLALEKTFHIIATDVKDSTLLLNLPKNDS